VVDWFNVGVFGLYVNLADAFLCLGALMLLGFLLRAGD
jgi:lipoprotein signal peptidase